MHSPAPTRNGNNPLATLVLVVLLAGVIALTVLAGGAGARTPDAGSSPLHLTVLVSGTRVSLSWSDSAHRGISSFAVYRDRRLLTTTHKDRFVDLHARAGVRYLYLVVARLDVGKRTVSSQKVTALVRGRTSGAAAKATGSNQTATAQSSASDSAPATAAPATTNPATTPVAATTPSGAAMGAAGGSVTATTVAGPATTSATTATTATPTTPTTPTTDTTTASTTTTATAASETATPAVGRQQLYWGAWIGSQFTGTEAPWDLNAISDFEQLTGKNLSMVNFSSPFYDCDTTPCSPETFPTSTFQSLYTNGIVPFFSWGSDALTPSGNGGSGYTLSSLLAGDYDAYIKTWAKAAASWGHPFFLRFDWEMNGNWFPWGVGVEGNTAAQYVAAWRHVYDIFQSAGATNATWVWCPNVDPSNSLAPLPSLYPGDAYVNWTCLDGYNGDDPWTSFSDLFRPTYDQITTSIAPSKPMVIAEVGATETGGSKATWITDMFASLATGFPDVRGLLWFDKYDTGPGGFSDWPLESSASATSAFAAGISDPAFLSSGASTSLADHEPIAAPG